MTSISRSITKRRDILDNLLRFRRKFRDSMAEGGEDYYNHIKEQENLGQKKRSETKNPTRDQREMYSETPHGAGALGLSKLQGQDLCLGEQHRVRRDSKDCNIITLDTCFKSPILHHLQKSQFFHLIP